MSCVLRFGALSEPSILAGPRQMEDDKWPKALACSGSRKKVAVRAAAATAPARRDRNHSRASQQAKGRKSEGPSKGEEVYSEFKQTLNTATDWPMLRFILDDLDKDPGIHYRKPAVGRPSWSKTQRKHNGASHAHGAIHWAALLEFKMAPILVVVVGWLVMEMEIRRGREVKIKIALEMETERERSGKLGGFSLMFGDEMSA